MQQFAFSATDKVGNTVEGAVTAPDMIAAAEQVRQMGYTPVRVEIATGEVAAAAPAVSASLPMATVATAPAPFDLTQPVTEMPAAANALLVPVGEGNHAGEVAHIEPWQRGGPVPQPPAPIGLRPTALATSPAVTPASGSVVPSQATPEVIAAAGRDGAGRAPFGPGVPREVSLAQRFKEAFIYPINSGVVLKELAPFYRQFATLINAGLPLYQSLVALESNTKNAKLKEIARAAQEQVQAGGRFSDVMAAYPWIFQPLQIEMVRAAELGGMLDQILRQIADYVDHELSIRRLISYETFYPKLVLFVALMILGRPGFTEFMPAIAKLVVGSMGKLDYSFADYLRDTIGFGLMFLLPVAAAVIVFRLFLFNVASVRESYDSFKLSIPVLGNIIKMFVVAKFTRIFAALYRGGFSMADSIQIASNSSSNWVLRRATVRAFRTAQQGGLASEALRSSGFFPSMAVDMFRTGEMTGNLDEMMEKVADHYEAEAKTKSHQAALIFSAVVFLLVAMLVFFAVLGFYGGYAGRTTGGGE